MYIYTVKQRLILKYSTTILQAYENTNTQIYSITAAIISLLSGKKMKHK